MKAALTVILNVLGDLCSGRDTQFNSLLEGISLSFRLTLQVSKASFYSRNDLSRTLTKIISANSIRSIYIDVHLIYPVKSVGSLSVVLGLEISIRNSARHRNGRI